MRGLKRWAWAAVLASLATTQAAAQQGTITSSGGYTSGSLTGTGGLAGGGAGQLGSGTGGSSLQGTTLQKMQAAPSLTPPTGTASSSLQKSNFLSGYYANPYFQGTISSGTNATPGGFGSALYGNTSGTTGSGSSVLGTGSRLGLTTGGGGSSSNTGLGGRGGYGSSGLGGLGGNASNISGIVVPIPVQIAYTAQMQFPTPRVAPTRLQTDLRSALDGTTMLTNSKNVQIITDANNNVILRGTVADADEVRFVEGLIRVTPGVGTIKNELTPAIATSGK